MIARKVGTRIGEALRFFPAVVVTGARQTGKTTLVRALLPQYSYVSLDLPSTAMQAETAPDLFFGKYSPPLIIDEVQYAPRLFRHLKARIDADRHAMGSYVLTGSRKFVLMKEISESLAGRVAIVELEGLSAEELGGERSFSIEDYIYRGGFPELWRVPDFPESSFFSAYLSTYLERDVRQILNVGSLRDFERFIRVLAVRNAQQLDMSAVGRAVGATTKTIVSWISVLEASNQIRLLEPWHGNLGKRIVKTPKVYFCDTGLLAWLLGIGRDHIADSPFIGALWETAVYAELRRAISARGVSRQIYYYRDNQGTEVDFLVLGEGVRFVECKWTAAPRSEDARSMERLARAAGEAASPELDAVSGTVLCRVDGGFELPGTNLKVMARGLAEVPDLLEPC